LKHGSVSNRILCAEVATDRKPRPGLKHDDCDFSDEDFNRRDGPKTQTGIET